MVGRDVGREEVPLRQSEAPEHVIVALCALAVVAAFFVFSFMCRSKASGKGSQLFPWEAGGKRRIGREKKNRSTVATRDNDDDDDGENGLFTVTKDAYDTGTDEEADETELRPLVLRPGHVTVLPNRSTAKPPAWSPVRPAVSPALLAVSPVGEPPQPAPVLAPALAPHQPGPVVPAVNSAFRSVGTEALGRGHALRGRGPLKPATKAPAWAAHEAGLLEEVLGPEAGGVTHRAALRRGMGTEAGLGLGQAAVTAGVGAAAVDPPPSAALPFEGRGRVELHRQAQAVRSGAAATAAAAAAAAAAPGHQPTPKAGPSAAGPALPMKAQSEVGEDALQEAFV
jgi:hypothetical protein